MPALETSGTSATKVTSSRTNSLRFDPTCPQLVQEKVTVLLVGVNKYW